jgi:hypothetical protein
MRKMIPRRVGCAQPQGWLSLPKNSVEDPVVKPAPYLPVYEQLLASLRSKPFTLLELGVWTGQSLEMWRDAFPLASILGVDLSPPDLQLGSRVHIVQGDQTDAELMRRMREDYAPNGFDVIIDDASHFGVTTARSLKALYAQHLRSGGIYCIEDWGTGYLPSWHDGGQLASPLDTEYLDNAATSIQPDVPAPVSMPSHDVGMVGLIKRLIDHAAGDVVRSAQPGAVGDLLAIESMTVWKGIVVLRKPSA